MAYLAVYVTVYEHKGTIFPGFTREFMRHSSILVDKGDGLFDVFHVTGTPGIGLTFSHGSGWEDPRTETARLLWMEFVAWIPESRYPEMEPLLNNVNVKVSTTWNCQDWVRAGLDAMVAANFITPEQRDSTVQHQLEAVSTPFSTETPNARALQD
jgi:hypothetical protein